MRAGVRLAGAMITESIKDEDAYPASPFLESTRCAGDGRKLLNVVHDCR